MYPEIISYPLPASLMTYLPGYRGYQFADKVKEWLEEHNYSQNTFSILTNITRPITVEERSNLWGTDAADKLRMKSDVEGCMDSYGTISDHYVVCYSKNLMMRFAKELIYPELPQTYTYENHPYLSDKPELKKQMIEQESYFLAQQSAKTNEINE